MQREFKISLSQEFYSDIVYLSQYDSDYPVIFTVTDKYSKASGINGYTAKFTGTRGDGTGLGFTYTTTAIGHTVSFTIDTMLTGVAGTHAGEIIFYDQNGLYFGTANVQIIVEPAARPDGTIDADEEELRDLAQQCQDIVDTAAAEVKGEAEAWAVGERDGEPVPSTDPAYQNNAKYYAEQAAQIAEDISGVTNQVATNTSDISDLKEDLNASNSSVYPKWEKGTFDSATGEYYSADTRIRTDYMAGLPTGVEKICSENGFSMLLFAWDVNGNFIGSYKTSDTFTTDTSGYKYVTEFDCNSFPNYVVKVSVKDATGSTSIAVSDGANIHFQFNDDTLSKKYKSADAKKTGDKFSELYTIAGRIEAVAQPVSVGQWEQGSINSSTGKTSSSTTRIRTKSYTQFSPNTPVHFSITSGHGYRIFNYASELSDSYVGATDMLSGDYTIAAPTGYYRIIVYYSNNADITTDEASALSVFTNVSVKKYAPIIARVSTQINRGRMEFGAHRGAEYYAPINSIAAYRVAGEQGWEWAWIAGVRASSDGTLWVMHDATVDATTDGTGNISDMTDEQIRALNIDYCPSGSAYSLDDFDASELKVPTLEEVIQICLKYGMKMCFRVQSLGSTSQTPYDAFAELVHAYGLTEDDYMVSMYNTTQLQYVIDAFGDEKPVISFYRSDETTPEDFLSFVNNNRIIREYPNTVRAIINADNLTLAGCKTLHSNGIKIDAYKIPPTADLVLTLASWGVDILQNNKIYEMSALFDV